MDRDELITRLRDDARRQAAGNLQHHAEFLEKASNQPLGPEALARLAEAMRALEQAEASLVELRAAEQLLADLLGTGGDDA